VAASRRVRMCAWMMSGWSVARIEVFWVVSDGGEVVSGMVVAFQILRVCWCGKEGTCNRLKRVMKKRMESAINMS